MIINNSCVVMLVGHGAISNNDPSDSTKTQSTLESSSIGDHVLIYPVPPSDPLERFGHNVLLHSFNQSLKPETALTNTIEVKSVSYCNKTESNVSFVGDSTTREAKDYIANVKMRTVAEHSVANADNVLSNIKSLLPDQIPGYTFVKSLNFSTSMEGDMKKNLEMRKLDQGVPPGVSYVDGLGFLAIYYHKQKIEVLLNDRKNAIIKANTDLINSRDLLIEELESFTDSEDLSNANLTSTQKNALDALYADIQSNSSSINTIWAEIVGKKIFTQENHKNLYECVERYQSNFDKFANIKNSTIKFDSNMLLYITLSNATGNTRGLKIFWSSFIKSATSLYIAFTNNILDKREKEFTLQGAWFTTTNDNLLQQLKNNAPDGYLIVSIPSDANIVFSACRVLSTADIVKNPVTAQDVTIFPEF